MSPFPSAEAPETAHSVAFEMCKIDHKVIIGKILANEIVGEICSILHWQRHAAFSVHNIHNGYLSVAALLDGASV